MDTIFTAPEGFDVEGMKEGDEQEVLAKVKYIGDGSFALISVDGYDLRKESEETEEYEGEEEGEEVEVEEEGSYPEQLMARAGLG